MDTVVIVNPASANGSTGENWPGISARLTDIGVEHQAEYTVGPGHATDLCAQALANGAKTIVAVGGDGTVNEVANGFFRDGVGYPDAALALLPLGTGGDFRRTLGIPLEVDAATLAIRARRLRRIDVGEVRLTGLDGGAHTRRFVNIAEAGLGAVVVDRVNHTSKRLGGRLSFLYGSLATLWSYRPQWQRIVGGAAFDGPAQNLVIANCRYFGGGMFVAPAAEPDDGVFDVLVFGDIGRFEAMTSIGDIYSAKHLKNPKVVTWTAAEVTSESSDRVLVEVDGEMCGVLPATFTVLPLALSIVVP